ncbi:hypothetical protein NUU61_007474 [Penicillium alfredii]|uniref:Uncharacterized protein n=1 Tax=Penicillium alfredii TaxID=1506179 RepID=A0A9W9F2Y2_9EURO|nr:uncharacterized protein NUU61_007474 [Penicillium alfredii]KAJ5092604.1 hypothetical protein NUU61_007474 [Penicillium alfredii]
MPFPLTVTFVQSTILNAVANILAQLIDQRKSTTPFTLNLLPFLQFITYGVLIVPINFYWQRALEVRYPGFPSRAEFSNALRRPWSWASSKDRADILPQTKDAEKKHVHWAPRAKKSGLHSFAMKFLLDQSVGSVVNIVLFIVLINFLKGESVFRSWELVLEDFPPIMVARLKYRPLVSTLMYTIIPVDRRVVFGSACGVIWGVYLSLYAVV